MSIKTWEDEFMPIPVNQALGSDREALDHSILKWNGLRDEAIIRHGVRLSRCRLLDESHHIHHFNSCGCTLCQRALRKRSDSKTIDCSRCLVTKTVGVSCTESIEECKSPWEAFENDNNPVPMQLLLLEVDKKLTEQENLNKEEITMELKITKQVEKTLEIGLVHNSNNELVVKVISLNGENITSESLFTFHTDGSVKRHSAINSNFGFPLNKRGQIELLDW